MIKYLWIIRNKFCLFYKVHQNTESNASFHIFSRGKCWCILFCSTKLYKTDLLPFFLLVSNQSPCWAGTNISGIMTGFNVEHVWSTSWPWGSIWSTRCRPMRSRGPWPDSTQHRPSHKPRSGAKASGIRQCLSPGRVVATKTNGEIWRYYNCAHLGGALNSLCSSWLSLCLQGEPKRGMLTSRHTTAARLLPSCQLPTASALHLKWLANCQFLKADNLVLCDDMSLHHIVQMCGQTFLCSVSEGPQPRCVTCAEELSLSKPWKHSQSTSIIAYL